MVDLHVHSTHSDGTLTPQQLIDLASSCGLSCIALTDHDTVSGLKCARLSAQLSDVDFIPGLEISVERPRAHILGYGIDPDNTALQRALERVAESRRERNLRMVRRLQELGYSISLEEAIAQAGGEILGRPHIAKVLVRKGYFTTISSVFESLIGSGRSAYVERERLTAREGIGLIRSAGGVAVLAHPGLLSPDLNEVAARIETLRDEGLQGIEAIYTEHSEELSDRLIDLACEKGLIWTGGTDFHGDNKDGIRLGIGKGNLAIPDGIADRLKSLIELNRHS